MIIISKERGREKKGGASGEREEKEQEENRNWLETICSY